MLINIKMGKGALSCRLGFFAQLPQRAFAHAPLGFSASLLLMPQRLFISFARTKETKQRKFAVCTFWATPALFSAKQKELATLKQLFVFYAPKSTCASRPKSEAGPLRFYATLLRSLGCDVFFFSFAHFFVIQSGAKRSEGSRVHPHHERSDVPSKEGYFRPPWRSVKKFLHFSVKNKKLFERSEFFLFRNNVKILASERQPAVFLFVIFFFLMAERKSKPLRLEQKFKNPCQNILWAG